MSNEISPRRRAIINQNRISAAKFAGVTLVAVFAAWGSFSQTDDAKDDKILWMALGMASAAAALATGVASTRKLILASEASNGADLHNRLG